MLLKQFNKQIVGACRVSISVCFSFQKHKMYLLCRKNRLVFYQHDWKGDQCSVALLQCECTFTFGIETHDFRCNSFNKHLPSWPKRFFRASGQGLVTTSPSSAWCQQEKLSHMPGQPVERNTHATYTHITVRGEFPAVKC